MCVPVVLIHVLFWSMCEVNSSLYLPLNRKTSEILLRQPLLSVHTESVACTLLRHHHSDKDYYCHKKCFLLMKILVLVLLDNITFVKAFFFLQVTYRYSSSKRQRLSVDALPGWLCVTDRLASQVMLVITWFAIQNIWLVSVNLGSFSRGQSSGCRINCLSLLDRQLRIRNGCVVKGFQIHFKETSQVNGMAGHANQKDISS